MAKLVSFFALVLNFDTYPDPCLYGTQRGSGVTSAFEVDSPTHAICLVGSALERSERFISFLPTCHNHQPRQPRQNPTFH